MLRRGSINGGVVGLALAAALSGPGCADDSVAVHVICPSFGRLQDDACVYDPDGDCLAQGTVNVAYGNDYRMALRMESGLSSRASEVPVRGETNGINVTEFEVTLRRPGGKVIKFDGLKNPYKVRVSGRIPPGGQGIALGIVVPFTYMQTLGEAASADPPLRQVIASIKVRGETDGAEPVEAAAWDWPIELVTLDLVDEKKGECFATNAGVPCGTLGQDGLADVCECSLRAACTTATDE